MNAHCERNNRAIQEDFVDCREDLLFRNAERASPPSTGVERK